MVSEDAPDNVVAVPDLEVHPELDPLSITVDKVGLVNFMGEDSLAVVLDDLYAATTCPTSANGTRCLSISQDTAQPTPPC